MDISIIITYYSGLNIIQNCLYSLYDSLKTTKYSYEIIVVNDNPNIKLENYLQDFSSLKILNHEINMGHPAACNNGAKIATGQNLILWIVIFLLLIIGWKICIKALLIFPI